MAMPKAHRLMPEIWLEISQYLDERSEIAALAQVNRFLHNIFQTELYRVAIAKKAPEITILAAAAGNLETLQVAASFGADLDNFYSISSTCAFSIRDSSYAMQSCWGTPLHYAAYYGHYNVVRWLIAHGVNLNAAGRFLCQCKPLGCRLPMPHRDDPTVMSNFPAWTPLHHAICRGHTSVAKLLISAGSNEKLLVPAGSEMYPEKWHDEHDDGATEDDASVYSDDSSLFGHSGHHINDRHPFDLFVTDIHPIHVAAAANNKSLVSYLISEKDVDVDRLDDHLATPLYHAIAAEQHLMVSYLIALGADTAKPRKLRVDEDFFVFHHNALDFALAHDIESCRVILDCGKATWIKSVDDDGRVRYKSTLRTSLTEFSMWLRHPENVVSLISYTEHHDRNIPHTFVKLLPRFCQATLDDISMLGVGDDWLQLFREEMQMAFIIAFLAPEIYPKDLGVLRQAGDILQGGGFSLGSLMPRANLVQLMQLCAEDGTLASMALPQWLRPDSEYFDSLSQCSIGTLALIFLIGTRSSGHIDDTYYRVKTLIGDGAATTMGDPRLLPCSPMVLLLNQFMTDPYFAERSISWTSNTANFVQKLGENGGWIPITNGTAQDMRPVIDKLIDTLPMAEGRWLLQVTEYSMPDEIRDFFVAGLVRKGCRALDLGGGFSTSHSAQ